MLQDSTFAAAIKNQRGTKAKEQLAMPSKSLLIFKWKSLIIDGIFNWKSLSTCSVRYQFPASVSRPLRGGCGFCVPCTCLRFCLPTVSPPWHRCVSWKTGKYTVPVGQSPLAAGCLVAPPRSWPFRVTHRAAIAHLDLDTGHQNSGSGSCHGFLFLGKKAVATATGDPNAGMCRAT